MKIYKLIIYVLALLAMLGFARVYAQDLGSLGNAASQVGQATKNEDLQKYGSQAQKVDTQYDQAMTVKKQIEAVKTPEQAFSILEQNSSTLGINAADLKELKTAFTSANTMVQTGSRLKTTLDQLSKDPNAIINNPQALAQARRDIDDGIKAFESLEQAADKLGDKTSAKPPATKAKDALKTVAVTLNPPDAGAVKAAAGPATILTGAATLPGVVAPTGAGGSTTAGTGEKEYSMRIKNWENQGSLILSPNSTVTNIQTDICDKMFAGDEKNLFKDVVCSLIRVVSASTAQFSTQMTCNIQSIPVNSNYFDKTRFRYDPQGVCRATNTDARIYQSHDSYIYGSQDDTNPIRNSGFYSGMPSVLTTSLTTSGNGTNQTFTVTKWILAFGAVVALLIFAFANILNIEISSYAIKKALPKVVVALVGGWLSLAIVGLVSRFVDIAYRLNLFSPYQSLHPMANIFMGNFGSGPAPAAGASLASVDLSRGISLIFDIGGKFLDGGQGATLTPSFSAMILGSFFLVVPAIAVLIFEYVLALRPFIVQLLAAAGPLAFASLILPQTQFLFRKWWTYLLIALFYPLAINFVFFFLNKMDGGTGYGSATFFAIWSFKIFIILLLARMPFTIESDFRKISQKIAGSELGASLGLSKIIGKTGKQPESSKSPLGATGENLSSEKAKGLIAPVARKFFRGLTAPSPAQPRGSIVNAGQLQNMPFVPATLSRILANADQINAGRNSSLIRKSIEDIPSNTLKAVVDRNDLQLWRDTRLIEQLKNKDGQVLDDQGTAIRADSVRKAMRLAQIAENGKLINGDLIKLFAGKSMLSSLPQDLVKEAVSQNILSREDLIPSYGNNYQKVLESTGNSLINLAKAKELMTQDHNDYLTGFNEIRNGINSSLKSGIGTSAQQVVGSIAQKMRQGGTGNLMKNSDYYLQRLSSDKNQAVSALAGTLTQAGVENKSALSLAQNTAIGAGQIAKYIPKQQQNEATFQQIKEGLLNRDVSSGLIGEISGIITQEKTTASRGITQKIAETFKNDDTTNMYGIQKTVQEVTEKLSGPLSPAEIEEAATKINKYHPGSKIKTNQQYDQNDIDQIKERAEEVLDTTKKLQKSGLDEKKIVENPIVASQAAEREITKDIQNKAKGAIASDGAFNQNLNGFAKAIKDAT